MPIQVSRGGSDKPSRQTTTSLKYHMEHTHPESYSINQVESSESGEANADVGNNRKRASGCMSIFRLRSKKERTDFLQSSIPDWIEANTMLDIDHPRAQKIHKSIFEMMLVDQQPFNMVNRPGFLRHHYLLAPNFDVCSDKYYREMLAPTYDKIRDAVKSKLEADSPPLICVGLDGWSKFHQVGNMIDPLTLLATQPAEPKYFILIGKPFLRC